MGNLIKRHGKFGADGLESSDGVERVASDSFMTNFEFQGVESEFMNAGGAIDVLRVCGIQPRFNKTKKAKWQECQEKVQEAGFEKRDAKTAIKESKASAREMRARAKELRAQGKVDEANALENTIAAMPDDSMSTGAIIGISVGVVAVVGLTLFFVFRKK